MATDIRRPDNGEHRIVSRTRALTRSLARESSAPDYQMMEASRLCEEFNEGADERFDKILERDTRVLPAIIAHEKSNIRPDGPIRKHQSLAGKELQTYHAASSSTVLTETSWGKFCTGSSRALLMTHSTLLISLLDKMLV